MKNNSGSGRTSTSVYVILYAIALAMTVILCLIDINSPIGLSVGVLYSLVIVYTWILPGKNIPIYAGILFSVLVIIGFIFSKDELVKGDIIGLNRLFSIVVIWTTASMVMIAKKSLVGLERARDVLSVQVEIKTSDLRSRERQLRSLFDAANDAIITTDEHGIIIDWNWAAWEIFGWSKEEIMGKSVEIIIPSDYQDVHRDKVDQIRTGSDSRTVQQAMELDVVRKDGTVFPAEISLGSWEYSGKRWFCEIVRDMTERKEALRREQLAKSLIAKNKELEHFAYAASHDLQEPLNTISNMTELLAEESDSELSEEAKTYLEYLDGSAQRMKLLIDDLLSYSRIGKEQEMKEVDLIALIQEVLVDLDHQIKKYDAKIETSPLFTVEGHESSLRLLFQNLISNGIKFHKEGKQPKVTVEGKDDRQFWEIVVSDNGIGIKEEDYDRIFDIFKRLNHSSVYSGSGIGLANCKKVVEMHGGSIDVDSKPGEGSSFKVRLPKKADKRS